MKYILQIVLSCILVFGFTNSSLAAQGRLDVKGQASVFEEPDLLEFYVVFVLASVPGDQMMTVYRQELERVLNIIERHNGKRSRQDHHLAWAGRGYYSGRSHDEPFMAEGWLDVEVPAGPGNGRLLDEIQKSAYVELVGVEWDSSKRADLIAQARTLAIKDALSKAEEMAGATDKRVGAIVRIGKLPRLPKAEPRDFLPVLAMNASADSGRVPLMPGLIEFKQEIEVEVSLLPLD